MGLDGKRIVIIGGTSGIGLAVARGAHRRGR
jgi:NAD(P)-dependent dehydrogenase (short-subunit alcohol dehydrogenase family)